MQPAPSLLAELRGIVGPEGYLDSPDQIEPYLTDHRRLYRGATPLVLRPGSTEEVAAILRACSRERVGVVPVGGNTSYCGGATPSSDGSQVVVSMSRMRRIRRVDAHNFTVTAEAGCVLSEIQDAASAVDRLFPLSLGSEGSCQLGGNLSTNAGGTAVLRYGMVRDLVLGLEVVLPDGRVLDNLKGLRKDNTGYDLRDLFIGAEGTLGIITAAVCKLYSRPTNVFTAWLAVPDPSAAVRLLAQLRASSADTVTTFELMPRVAIEWVLQHVERVTDPLDRPHPWYVLLEIGGGSAHVGLQSSMESTLSDGIEQGTLLDAAIAHSQAQREALWRIRETIPEAQRRVGASIKHDISVPTSELPRFIEEATRLVHSIAPRGRVIAYGHLGDGNLHFNVSEPLGGSAPEFLACAPRIQAAVHDLVATFGGSFSAEHGIGQLKRAELARYKAGVAIDLMRTLKQAIDPHGIMNPGKVL